MLNFLDFIKAKYDPFSPKEKKIADVVLKEPQKVIAASIAQVAKNAAVSEPTVHRFCQKINTDGFPDFKLKLAQSLAKGILPKTIPKRSLIHPFPSLMRHAKTWISESFRGVLTY